MTATYSCVQELLAGSTQVTPITPAPTYLLHLLPRNARRPQLLKHSRVGIMHVARDLHKRRQGGYQGEQVGLMGYSKRLDASKATQIG